MLHFRKLHQCGRQARQAHGCQGSPHCPAGGGYPACPRDGRIVWGCCLIRHRCALFQNLQLLLEFITHCVFYTLVRCCSSEIKARSYIKFNRMSSVRCDSVCSVHILCSIVQCVTGLRRQEAKRVEN